MFRIVIFVGSLMIANAANAQIGSPYDPGIGQAKPDVYRQLEPLDITHSNNQRIDVKRLFLSVGYNLKTDETDLSVMQKLLDLRKVRRDDIATQQALGLVFGDILAKQLNMEWVIVEDTLGRSRALRYRDSDIVIFPVTMISRRYKSGVNVDVKKLYNKVFDSTSSKITNLHRYS